MNQSMFPSVYHAQPCCWNQSVLSNEDKVSSLMKQWEHLMGFDLTTDRLLNNYESNAIPTTQCRSLIWTKH